MFRLGSTMHRRRGWVVIAWLVLLVVLGGASRKIGSEFRSDFDIDSESASGFDLLREHFEGLGTGLEGQIVFKAEQGVDDPEVREVMSEYFAEVQQLDDRLNVRSPYSIEGTGQISTEGEQAGLIAFAQLDAPLRTSVQDTTELGREILERAPEMEGLQVELGGSVFSRQEPPESEMLGVAAAIIILIVAFGSVLAMGLPIATAMAGIGAGAALTVMASNFMSTPDFAPTMALMIGLGVGIDYALFIVTRYREELHRGHGDANAAGIALDTAGRAVLFAGTTVVISLSGMLVMGLPFVTGLGIAAATTVAVTMLASVTLLPALLGFAGHRLEITRLRGLVAAVLVSVGLVGLGINIDALLVAVPVAAVVLVAGFFIPGLRRELPRRPPKPLEHQWAWRWSRFVQRHPVIMSAAGFAFLGVLTIPVFSMRMGFADEGNYPEETTTRRAYDLISEGFGPGFNGPLIVVSELPEGAGPEVQERLASVTAAITADEAVGMVNGPIPNDFDISTGQMPDDLDESTAVLWRVVPADAPQSLETEQLVQRLRDELLPEQLEGLEMEPAVTGFTALGVDFSVYLEKRIPYFFGLVLMLSFVLLLMVFRSILVPLKAVLMNLLSVAACYGVVVAVFQWAWGGDVLKLEPAPIEPFLPMILFAIIFGLSMDYEVFLLSRVKEEYDRHGENAKAVADGLAATARLITAAAAIMVCVFAAFMLDNDRAVKLFGMGLAVAIALDATVVRILLVPATMELLGDSNWWIPRWIDRVMPKLDVEGGHDVLLDPVDEAEALEWAQEHPGHDTPTDASELRDGDQVD